MLDSLEAIDQETEDIGVRDFRDLSILVVDDERLIRDVLTMALEQRLSGVRVDTAPNLAGALEHLERRPETNVVVLDYKMPDMRGLASVSRVVRSAARGRVLVLSGHVNSDLANDLSRVGVSAALTKDVGMSELASKIVDVVEGARFFDLPSPVDRTSRIQAQFGLSKREAEIFRRIVNGDRNADIAHKLGISESTVRVHVYNVFKKLGVTSRIEAFNCWNAGGNGKSKSG